jgi:outer membrane protein OmpA-like peptidoglycan-associated protein
MQTPPPAPAPAAQTPPPAPAISSEEQKSVPGALPSQAPSQDPVPAAAAVEELRVAARGIVFEPNSTIIAQQSSKVLEQAVRVLEANPTL